MKQILKIVLVVILFGSSLLQAQSLPESPQDVRAFGYDSHVELRWRKSSNPALATYRLYRAVNGNPFELVRSISPNDTLFLDFVRPLGTNLELEYQLFGVNALGQESAVPARVKTHTFDMSDEELLTMVQAYTFRYFWDFGHPVSGLARERNTSGDLVTSGGSGFGVMAIIVGIERGFITREQGLNRLITIVDFLERADRFRGAHSHWLNGMSGRVIPFSAQDNGGDIVESAFLLQGLLTVREYFDTDAPDEFVLREKITNIWQGVDWNWYRKQNQNVLFWHWSPNFNFAINLQLRGFNETHIVYLLAISAPSNRAIPPSLYRQGWAGGAYTAGSGTYYGYRLDTGPQRGGPLFFSHYSYLGFDPRYLRDEFTNYFVRNRNHTLINRAYCIENPKRFPGYSEVSWGLTASDNPFGYSAHEPTPARDNGTITPTAALSSMPYTPEESIAALKHFYRDRGARLWGPMGFYDAFNDAQNWVASSYLAIDQGPIICMIENYRTGLLWKYFMRNPEIQLGLAKAGFVPDSTLVATHQWNDEKFGEIKIYPNPISDKMMLALQLTQLARITITLVAINGLEYKKIMMNEKWLYSGESTLELDLSGLENGVYLLNIQQGNQQWTEKVIIQH
jgi:hypothetical protein